MSPRPRRIPRRYATRVAAIWSDDSGSPVVEFALIAPFFLLIVTATFDIGLIINSRFTLAAQISAAANFGQMKGASIPEGDAVAFAGTVATILSAGSSAVAATVVLNNAASATMTDGQLTTTDSSGTMTDCYCPTRVDRQVQWGSVRTCLALCSDGSKAGKFIEISASSPYVSLFGGYGMTRNDTITSSAVVRLE
ncbi:MAG: TadE/TadG family type IV pilus assembly protein [Gemmobacter sp.]|nr:TadE/TadG family type IV pilus assembly protein [Gemmobacter sp.]